MTKTASIADCSVYDEFFVASENPSGPPFGELVQLSYMTITDEMGKEHRRRMLGE
jgi:hypothetical protein